jgi:small-conductance mechanosensitive channel
MKSRFIFFLVYFALAASVFAGEQSPVEIFTDARPATLTIWNREIAVFRARLGGITPEERLQTTIQRLKNIHYFHLYKEVIQKPLAINQYPAIGFFLDDTFLFALFKQDLNPETRETLEQVAEGVVARLNEVREAQRSQSQPSLLLRGAAFSVTATVAFLLLIWVLKKLQKLVRSAILRRTAKLKWMKIRDFDMRRFLLQAVRHLTKIIFFIIAFIGAYVWSGFVLAQFPYTAPWAEALRYKLRFLAVELLSGLVEEIPSILTVVAILLITRWVTTIVDGVSKSLERDSERVGIFSGDTARATRRIMLFSIWVAGIVIAYPYIPGSESLAFKGISVFLGLVVSLGSTGVVNQIMSGFVVLYSGAVRTGEYAKAGDVEGTVIEISLLSTRILTPKKEYVTVPNAVLMGKNTINYSRMQEEDRTEVSTKVTIGYDTPWRQVEAMLLLAADRTRGVRKKPVPRVFQTALSDFYVEYELRFVPGEIQTKNATLSLLHQQILDVFNEFEVQIMSPNFVDQPQDTILVSKDNWFLPPAGKADQIKKK